MKTIVGVIFGILHTGPVFQLLLIKTWENILQDKKIGGKLLLPLPSTMVLVKSIYPHQPTNYSGGNMLPVRWG